MPENDSSPDDIRIRPAPPGAFEAAIARLAPEARQKFEHFRAALQSAPTTVLLRREPGTPTVAVVRGVRVGQKATDAIVLRPGATPRDLGRALAALLEHRQRFPVATPLETVSLSLFTGNERSRPDAELPFDIARAHGTEEVQVEGIGRVVVVTTFDTGLVS